MKEEVLLFGQHKELVGIITYPTVEKIDTHHPIFIFLNSGFIHRVGFSRVHVTIARKLAKMGHVSFRMDSSGIGDSLSGSDNLEIDQRWVNETRQAMDLISLKTGIDRFVIVGNCSGADLSFRTASCDQRVISAVLINPMSNKILLEYYIRLAIFMPSLWLRLLKGKLKFKKTFQSYRNIKALNRHMNNSGRDDMREKIIESIKDLAKRECRLFIIHCEWDPNYCYYKKLYKKELSGLVFDNKIKVAVIKGMNHDFFLVRGLMELTQMIQDWSQAVADLPAHR